MIRVLLLLCCVLIGMDFIDDYAGLDAYADNLDWLSMAQRIAITATALLVVVTEYIKNKSFNVTMLIFFLAALIYNPFVELQTSMITRIAVIVLFFVQALKSGKGKLIG